MATGYEDIDNLMTEQRQNLNDQRTLQNQIIDKGIEKVQNEVTRIRERCNKDSKRIIHRLSKTS